MKAVQFASFGEPSEVLQVVERERPQPGPGEVLVRMHLSPINPSDLLVTRGRYGVLPELPATPGFEGVGTVEAIGPGPAGVLAKPLLLGKRVMVLNQAGGNWAESVTIPALRAIPVPKDLADEQVASLFVNPATALAMTRYVLKVPQGSWLLQTAANSELGQMIIRLGKHEGFRTLNVVRRKAAEQVVRQAGGDAVVNLEDGPLVEQVNQITDGQGVKFAIDPVGGQIGSDVFACLDADARMLVYGLLSDQPIQFDPRAMIAGKRIIEGFWLGHFMQSRSKIKIALMMRELVDLNRKGILRTEVGGSYPLDQVTQAVTESEQSGRSGKIYLRCL